MPTSSSKSLASSLPSSSGNTPRPASAQSPLPASRSPPPKLPVEGGPAKELSRRGSSKDLVKNLHSGLTGALGQFMAEASALEDEDSCFRKEVFACMKEMKELIQQEADERVQQVQQLEKQLAEEVEKRKTEDKSLLERMEKEERDLQERVENLESMFGAWADKHTHTVEQLKDMHNNLSQDLDDVKVSHDKHKQETQETQELHKKIMDEHSQKSENGMVEVVHKHEEALAAANARLEQVHRSAQSVREAQEARFSSFEQTHKSLALATEQASKAIVCANARIAQLNDGVQSQDKRLTGVEEKVAAHQVRHEKTDGPGGLESRLAAATARSNAELESVRSEYALFQDQTKEKLKDLNEIIAEEARARDMHLSSVHERLEHQDRKHGINNERQDNHAKDMRMVRDIHGRQEKAIEAIKDQTETALGELARNTARELKSTRDDLEQVLNLLSCVQRAWRPCIRGRRISYRGNSMSPGTPTDPKKEPFKDPQHQGSSQDKPSMMRAPTKQKTMDLDQPQQDAEQH